MRNLIFIILIVLMSSCQNKKQTVSENDVTYQTPKLKSHTTVIKTSDQPAENITGNEDSEAESASAKANQHRILFDKYEVDYVGENRRATLN